MRHFYLYNGDTYTAEKNIETVEHRSPAEKLWWYFCLNKTMRILYREPYFAMQPYCHEAVMAENIIY